MLIVADEGAAAKRNQNVPTVNAKERLAITAYD